MCVLCVHVWKCWLKTPRILKSRIPLRPDWVCEFFILQNIQSLFFIPVNSNCSSHITTRLLLHQIIKILEVDMSAVDDATIQAIALLHLLPSLLKYSEFLNWTCKCVCKYIWPIGTSHVISGTKEVLLSIEESLQRAPKYVLLLSWHFSTLVPGHVTEVLIYLMTRDSCWPKCAKSCTGPSRNLAVFV